jgi:hypothetical protein
MSDSPEKDQMVRAWRVEVSMVCAVYALSAESAKQVLHAGLSRTYQSGGGSNILSEPGMQLDGIPAGMVRAASIDIKDPTHHPLEDAPAKDWFRAFRNRQRALRHRS